MTEKQLVSFKDIIVNEIQETQLRCATNDFDIEFLLDSSGSVGGQNWRVTVESIAEFPIKHRKIIS